MDKTVNLRITADLHSKASKIAAERGMQLSAMLRSMLVNLTSNKVDLMNSIAFHEFQIGKAREAMKVIEDKERLDEEVRNLEESKRKNERTIEFFVKQLQRKLSDEYYEICNDKNRKLEQSVRDEVLSHVFDQLLIINDKAMAELFKSRMLRFLNSMYFPIDEEEFNLKFSKRC